MRLNSPEKSSELLRSVKHNNKKAVSARSLQEVNRKSGIKQIRKQTPSKGKQRQSYAIDNKIKKTFSSHTTRKPHESKGLKAMKQITGQEQMFSFSQ